MTYLEIVRDIRLDHAFLDAHRKAVAERLERTVAVATSGPDSSGRKRDFCVSQALHLAATISLLGGERDAVHRIAAALRVKWLGRCNPGAIIAACTLRYLLSDYVSEVAQSTEGGEPAGGPGHPGTAEVTALANAAQTLLVLLQAVGWTLPPDVVNELSLHCEHSATVAA